MEGISIGLERLGRAEGRRLGIAEDRLLGLLEEGLLGSLVLLDMQEAAEEHIRDIKHLDKANLGGNLLGWPKDTAACRAKLKDTLEEDIGVLTADSHILVHHLEVAFDT